MKRIQIITALTLIWIFPIFIKAQTENCSVIDNSLPNHYLKLIDKKDGSLIYKIVNNFSCPIVIEIDDKPVSRVLRKADGTFKTQESIPQNGDEVTVHYYFLNTKNSPSFHSAVFSDTVSTIKLGKSESIYFRVEAKKKKSRQVAVKFLYEWEYKGFSFGGIGGNIADHFIYSSE